MNEKTTKKRENMKEKVFVLEAKRQALAAGLSDAAARVTALGKIVKAAAPQITFGVPFLWALMDCSARPWYPLRQLLADMILNAAAKKAGLDCGPGWNEKTRGYVETQALENAHPLAHLSDDAKLNRKFVELQCRKEVNAVLTFAIERDYLRAGLIVIGKDGEAAPAQDAAARLEDFCTLYAETKEQAAFIANLERMQRAAQELQAAFKDTCASLPAKQHRAALEDCSAAYDPAGFGLVPSGTISLTAQDATARALISYFDRTQDAAPKFYNLAGRRTISPAELFAITGGLAGDRNAQGGGQVVNGRQSGLKVYPAIIMEG